ncbi:MAG TPA: ECF-type sigma factor [Planctomycetota bacterium]|nr:ECF-type sigma factor [Planctomycetota bacterium]
MDLREITLILEAAEAGDRTGLDVLVPHVYDELRRLAGGYMRGEREGHTLQPTALANEVYLRLVDQTKVKWRGRAQFLAIAARAMRQILVDHARRHGAEKRGANMARVTLSDTAATFGQPVLDLLDLDEALTALGTLDDRKANVVELRFFAGLTTKEAAEALDVSETTVDDDWAMARAWLRRRLAG